MHGRRQADDVADDFGSLFRRGGLSGGRLRGEEGSKQGEQHRCQAEET